MICREKGRPPEARVSRSPRGEASIRPSAKRPRSTRSRQRIVFSKPWILLLAAFEVAIAFGQQGISRQKSSAYASDAADQVSTSSLPLSPEEAHAKEFLEEGRTQNAIPLLRDAIRLNAEDPEAHLLLGIALSAVPERSEALQELQKAVILEPGSAVAWFSLGNAHGRFGDIGEAQTAYENAVHLDPNFVQARIALALVLAQQKQLGAAKDNLVRAISQLGGTPSAAYPHYVLGRILLEQNHAHQALKELGAAIRLRPNYEEAYFTSGLAEISLHDDRAAADTLEKSVQLSPGDVEAEYQLGGALLRLGEAAQAIRPLRLTVEMRPNDRHARWQLCQSFRIAGRKPDAIKCQREMRALITEENAAMQDTAATRHNNRGVMLEKAGDLNRAVVNYRAAVTLNPNQTTFRRNLALALCRQGHWEQGVAELRKVLQDSPEDTEATKALYIALDHLKGDSSSAESSSAHTTKPGPP